MANTTLRVTIKSLLAQHSWWYTNSYFYFCSRGLIWSWIPVMNWIQLSYYCTFSFLRNLWSNSCSWDLVSTTHLLGLILHSHAPTHIMRQVYLNRYFQGGPCYNHEKRHTTTASLCWNFSFIPAALTLQACEHYWRYGHCAHAFTEGSKNPDNGKPSCAFYVPEWKVKVAKRKTDHTAVCSVQMKAISIALPFIEEIKPLQILIRSDSNAGLACL